MRGAPGRSSPARPSLGWGLAPTVALSFPSWCRTQTGKPERVEEREKPPRDGSGLTARQGETVSAGAPGAEPQSYRHACREEEEGSQGLGGPLCAPAPRLSTQGCPPSPSEGLRCSAEPVRVLLQGVEETSAAPPGLANDALGSSTLGHARLLPGGPDPRGRGDGRLMAAGRCGPFPPCRQVCRQPHLPLQPPKPVPYPGTALCLHGRGVPGVPSPWAACTSLGRSPPRLLPPLREGRPSSSPPAAAAPRRPAASCTPRLLRAKRQ